MFAITTKRKYCSLSGNIIIDINGSVEWTELLKWQTDKLILLDSSGIKLNSASYWYALYKRIIW